MRKVSVQIRITQDEEWLLKEWAKEKGFPLKAMPTVAFGEGVRCYLMEKYAIKAPDLEEVKIQAEDLQPEQPGIMSNLKHVLGIGKAVKNKEIIEK
jgi:hypothetical protein